MNVSNCCGEKPRYFLDENGHEMWSDDLLICPRCKENCEYVPEEDFGEPEMEILKPNI